MLRAPDPHPFDQKLLREASSVDGSVWKERYQRTMALAYERALFLLQSPDWELWEADIGNAGEPRLYIPAGMEMQDWMPLYGRFFKVECIVSGRADRYLWLLQDFEKDSRLPWEQQNDTLVSSVQQMETYCSEEGNIDVVKSVIKSPSSLTSDRLLMGIQNTHYNAQTKAHLYMFHTEDHHYFTPHLKDTVHRDCTLVPQCLVGVWLCPVDGGTRTHLKMVVSVHPGPMWAATPLLNRSMPPLLCKQVQVWERVVEEWKQWYPLDPKRAENRK
jgi:hypothetical protein